MPADGVQRGSSADRPLAGRLALGREHRAGRPGRRRGPCRAAPGGLRGGRAGRLRPPAGYLERQVARWRGQYEQHRVRDLPLFDSLGDWLEANRPAEGPPAILHGDFHLDNCLITPGPPARVSAIIDWELATVGDPLVDLGLLLGFWGTDRARPIAMERVQALSRLPGAPGRRALADYYTSLTGRSTAGADLLHGAGVVQAGGDRRGRLRALPRPRRRLPVRPRTRRGRAPAAAGRRASRRAG